MSADTIEGTRVSRKKICVLATVPYAIKVFMRAHIVELSAEYDVTVVANGAADELIGLLGNHVSFIPLQIERKISVKKDFAALIQLWRLFLKKKFDCVHSITPKAGLLSMVAAKLAGVPLRFHTFTGQVWATNKGFRRLALRYLDKILAMNATLVFADSHSQRSFLIENGVVKPSDINVLAEGSVAGVDLNRFKYNAAVRAQIRRFHKIPDNAIVFLFLGRLTREKGLMDLSRAFAAAAENNSRLHLLIVGPDEENIEERIFALARVFPGRVHRVGFVDCPEHYMSGSDVFCLPSYREGFGSALIEAAAIGLPAIASRIYGITDAVEDGVTGILHPPTSHREITEAMLLFASNDDLRFRMGAAARKRAVDKFSEARLTKAFSDFYHDRLITLNPS